MRKAPNIDVPHGFSGINEEQGDVILLKQTHSNICHSIEAVPDKTLEGDELVTTRPDLKLAVQTADCVPVLFDGGHSIGVAHAGWRGAFSGILEATLEKLQDTGAKDIKAALGPAIAQKSYEVSSGFEKEFIKEDEKAERFFKNGKTSEKLFFDLPGYVTFRLNRAGIKNIYIDPTDTYSSRGFYSYRRSTHMRVETTGRNISWIQKN